MIHPVMFPVKWKDCCSAVLRWKLRLCVVGLNGGWSGKYGRRLADTCRDSQSLVKLAPQNSRTRSATIDQHSRGMFAVRQVPVFPSRAAGVMIFYTSNLEHRFPPCVSCPASRLRQAQRHGVDYWGQTAPACLLLLYTIQYYY
jgi:hypothetical protein